MATTEIYSHAPALSLHDALPICDRDRRRHGGGAGLLPGGVRAGGVATSMCLIALALLQHPAYPLALIANRDELHARPTAAAGIDPRSEEHTSELQSLMRNSYAVFCLKNKKKKLARTDR